MSGKTRRRKIHKRKDKILKSKSQKRGQYRKKISGGNGISNHFFPYTQNEFTNDPSRTPIGNMSSRIMNGGKRRTFTKSKKKGGTPYAAMPLGTGSPLWQYPFTLFGTDANAGLLTATGIPLTSLPSDNSNYVKAIV